MCAVKSVAGLAADMAVACSICTHRAHGEIDAALIAGASTPTVAHQFGVGRSSVQRHAAKHLRAEIAQAAETREEAAALAILASATDLFERGEQLLGHADGILQRSPDTAAGFSAATRVIREMRATLELIADAIEMMPPPAPEPTDQRPDRRYDFDTLMAISGEWSDYKWGHRTIDGRTERVAPCPSCGQQRALGEYMMVVNGPGIDPNDHPEWQWRP
jgi:hypothetical protein